MVVHNVYERLCPQFNVDELKCPQRKLAAASLHHHRNQSAVQSQSVSTHVSTAWCPFSIHLHPTSNFELTSHGQFYVPLAPPHPWCCPVSYWLKISTEIIFSLPGLCFVKSLCYRRTDFVPGKDDNDLITLSHKKKCHKVLCS